MHLKSASQLFLTLTALLALPLMLSACESMDDGEMADSQPLQTQPATPESPFEAVPMIQDPQSEIWRPGYWRLKYGQFVWVPGQILQRPSPTAVWHSANWVHHNYGWSFQEGHWE